MKASKFSQRRISADGPFLGLKEHMSQYNRFRGAASLRRAVVAAALIGVTLGSASAQDYVKAERPKQEEFSNFVDLQRGGVPVVDPANNKATTERNRKLLERISQWQVFQLTEPQFHTAQGTDGMSKLVRDASSRMLFQPTRAKQNAQQKQFVDEFGKVTVANLEKILGNSKPVVRVNAARMLAEVARTGYDGAAEPCLAILQKPDESAGVKFWTLRGLRNLFAIVEDPALPEVSIFSRRDLEQAVSNKDKDLERRCIVALCNYVTRKHEIAPDTPANQLDGLRYVRREAIRALGHVRMQSVRTNGQFTGPVDARPALVLLRVANSDNPAPAPGIAERIEAAIGFCQLLTDRERDLNLDYALYYIGQALVEIGQFRVANLTNEDVPWKERAYDLQAALEGWHTHTKKQLLPEAATVKTMADLVVSELLAPIQQGQTGLNPNPQNVRAWLESHKPQSTSLFKNDAESVIRPPAANNAATGGR